MQEAPLNLITGTRIFGNFEPDRYIEYLTPFVENASKFGRVVIVSQEVYPYRSALENFVDQSSQRTGQEVLLKLSKTKGAESPADMCNQIIEASEEVGAGLFGIVSSDLASEVARVFDSMLSRMEGDPQLASVGVAIQGVHNLALLREVEQRGMGAITTDNYATLFHNNSCAIHRVRPIPGQLDITDRKFSRNTDQGALGLIELDGQQVPVGGNEEIELVLRLLQSGQNLDTLLLDGPYTIIRDPNKEVSSVDKKILRRPFVARRYQQHFGLTDEVISQYLQHHYQIEFPSS